MSEQNKNTSVMKSTEVFITENEMNMTLKDLILSKVDKSKVHPMELYIHDDIIESQLNSFIEFKSTYLFSGNITHSTCLSWNFNTNINNDSAHLASYNGTSLLFKVSVKWANSSMCGLSSPINITNLCEDNSNFNINIEIPSDYGKITPIKRLNGHVYLVTIPYSPSHESNYACVINVCLGATLTYWNGFKEDIDIILFSHKFRKI